MKIDKNWLIIILVTLISTIVVWWVVGLKTIYQNFDGPYYLVVAKSWYDKATIGKYFSFNLPLEYYPAHFPLYPIATKLISWLPLLNPLKSMLLINLGATAASAIVFFEILKNKKVPHALFMALVFLFIWPRMWAVRSIGSPETLFILWILLSLKYFELKRFWMAGLFGALAILTKSPGILLFPVYFLASKFDKKIWPTLLIPLALLLLFTFFRIQTGDFLAYFNSGDNIHLQALPFKIFDSSQPWVGSFWLEDIIWIYLIGGLGVYYAFQKDRLWGIFGMVFYSVILFVSHRDIARYSLPLIPIVLYGFSDLFKRKEVRIALILLIIPLYFYTLNFLTHNIVAISDWAPFLSK
ncbi:hypothetical protein HZB69_04040 [Candidatus Amesbacteria bacterium]|nr:hypothetical protein [Candidatus Amesbacteria bacterium]